MSQPDANKGEGLPGWTDDGYCFACGRDNPQGLKLEFKVEGNSISTSYTPEKRFQGYAGVVHGGIIGLILDETMVNLPWRVYKVPVVSAELVVRFKRPAKVGERLIFTAEMDENQRRVIITRGRACCEDGTLVAEAEAKCVKVQASL